ncbi:DUF2790 domain-containing protein [Pseudomonas umsongensis]|jgi:hypothetical protein|uniref:DUF2790 domain-containing protein n=1 Tax=Pseudomonas umsongensis TaxID=198618 RepID=A0AAE6ZWE3_9PSED|nr:DUF2790 domain-containing protein [Pseudomonas umsongensis]MBT9569647.1 DUF2790 domain-containing protein [Pseudomonas umsongensis]NWL21031.1 DUF2790 domain-containing protein [Pseudomonas umsongensis]QJC79793.1 DUF2790 domain-containing protein [Pseudomonas umsongensis]
MNSRALLVSIALVCASSTGIAQANDTTSAQNVPSYHYGMPLHVGKVIALNEPTTLDCEVITATMKYIDSQSGQPAEIAYRKLSDACSYQN